MFFLVSTTVYAVCISLTSLVVGCQSAVIYFKWIPAGFQYHWQAVYQDTLLVWSCCFRCHLFEVYSRCVGLCVCILGPGNSYNSTCSMYWCHDTIHIVVYTDLEWLCSTQNLNNFLLYVGKNSKFFCTYILCCIIVIFLLKSLYLPLYWFCFISINWPRISHDVLPYQFL